MTKTLHNRFGLIILTKCCLITLISTEEDMSRYCLITLLVFLFVVIAFSIGAFAQSEPQIFEAKSAVYLELGGSSGRYAVNYSRIIRQKGKLKLNASAGFTLLKYTYSIGPRGPKETTWLPAIPVEFTAFWGRSNHHLEIGIAVVSYLENIPHFETGPPIQETRKTVYGAAFPLRIGYRYQKPGGGFFYRVGYTPFFSPPVRGRENWVFEPRFAGVSIGKSF